ncbi:MAG: oligopeptide ABC transporter permease [Bacillus sp. (in: firmicutes)]
MLRYIFERIGYMFVTLFIIISLSFVLMETLPGSPFNDQRMPLAQKELLYEKYGLDQPVAIRYVTYLKNLVQGDLGVSFQLDNRPVTKIISERIGASAVLGIQAIIVGTVIGLLLGVIAALRHNSIIDYSAMLISVLGISIPSFVFAAFLQYWIGVKLQWLPIAFWGGFKYSIMPTIALSVGVIATIARYTRMEMLDVLGQEYITTAKAKGLSNVSIILKHGFRNTLIPIVTIIGPLVVSMMTGSLVIEKIFSVPGLGEQFVSSILSNDYPVIMGTTIFYAVLFIGVVLVVDILYGFIDPRIRLAGGGKNGEK